MNKTIELMIKRAISKKMNVKANQVTFLESWSISDNNNGFNLDRGFAINVMYNIYTNEGYKCKIIQYNKDDKVLVHNIEIAEQYRL